MRSAALFAVIPALLLWIFFASKFPLGDSDRYYHFALSRILAEKGAVRLSSLPQAEDVGWGDYFPDKEFLFHAIGAFAYRLGGERAVEVVPFVAALGTAGALYVFALGSLPAGLAFLIAFPFFFNHGFVLRQLFVRPFVLAVFAFTVLVAALLRRRRAWIFSAALLFALSYHALYIPFAALALFFASGWRSRWRFAAWGLAGLALGTLLNPYFPSNLVAMWQQLYGNYLAQHALSSVRFGGEIYSLTTSLLVNFYALPLLALIAGFFVLAKIGARGDLVFLLLLCALFLLLTTRSARGGEYLVPSLALLAVEAAALARPGKWIYAALGMAALAQLALLVHEVSASSNADEIPREEMREALAAIPAGPAKVFNCDWAQGAYLLHDRPDLRFVDVLDPLALYFHDRAKFVARESLRHGELGDPLTALRSGFGADYVLCRDGALATQLNSDPGAVPVGAPGSTLHLFRLAAAPDPAFVTRWEVKRLDTVKEALAYEPGEKNFEEANHAYLDFRAAGAPCFALHVPASEVASHAGADFWAVGGGPSMRGWRSGKKIFSSGKGFGANRSVQALVPITPPLKAGDRLDLVACGAGGVEFFGVSLSLWKKKALGDICLAKQGKPGFACLTPQR